MTKVRQRTEKIFFAMGTVCRITVFDEADVKATERAKEKTLELHRLFNVFDPESELSAINRNAGGEFVKVSEPTLRLIISSLHYARLSGGLFDTTCAPLTLLWKRALRNESLPADFEIESAKALVGYRNISVENGWVRLKKFGQMLELGATAKGFAADEAKRILIENGVENAIINFGGTVVSLGDERKIGIQNPFAKTGEIFATVEVKEKAVVSSGLYEQCFTKDGKSYHHIINPRTGFPSQSELAGVSLVGESAEELDFLSTTAFMLPLQSAVNMVSSFSAEGIFITKDGGVFVTYGLRSDGFEFINP